jgi:hypothetical protein
VKKTTDELILEYEAMQEDDLMDSPPHEVTRDREEDTFLDSIRRFFKRVKQLFKINCFHTFRT